MKFSDEIQLCSLQLPPFVALMLYLLYSLYFFSLSGEHTHHLLPFFLDSLLSVILISASKTIKNKKLQMFEENNFLSHNRIAFIDQHQRHWCSCWYQVQQLKLAVLYAL